MGKAMMLKDLKGLPHFFGKHHVVYVDQKRCWSTMIRYIYICVRTYMNECIYFLILLLYIEGVSLWGLNGFARNCESLPPMLAEVGKCWPTLDLRSWGSPIAGRFPFKGCWRDRYHMMLTGSPERFLSRKVNRYDGWWCFCLNLICWDPCFGIYRWN